MKTIQAQIVLFLSLCIVNVFSFEQVSSKLTNLGLEKFSCGTLYGGEYYFGTFTSPGNIVKVDANYNVKNVLTLNSTEVNVMSLVVYSNYGFFTTQNGVVIQIDFRSFSRVATINLNYTHGGITYSQNGYLYVVVTGLIIQIDMQVGQVVGNITMGGIYSALAYNGFAYLGKLNTIQKIDLSTNVVVASYSLQPGEKNAKFPVLFNDSIYFNCNRSLVQINTTSLSRVNNSFAFPYNSFASVISQGSGNNAGYAVYGNTDFQSVDFYCVNLKTMVNSGSNQVTQINFHTSFTLGTNVMFGLGTGIASINATSCSLVSSVQLDQEGYFRWAAIAGGYAYFAGGEFYATIRKINLETLAVEDNLRLQKYKGINSITIYQNYLLVTADYDVATIIFVSLSDFSIAPAFYTFNSYSGFVNPILNGTSLYYFALSPPSLVTISTQNWAATAITSLSSTVRTGFLTLNGLIVFATYTSNNTQIITYNTTSRIVTQSATLPISYAFRSIYDGEFGYFTGQDTIVQVELTNLNVVNSKLLSGNITGATYVNGIGYFALDDGKICQVNLTTLDLIDTIDIDNSNLWASATDGTYVYFGANSALAEVIQVSTTISTAGTSTTSTTDAVSSTTTTTSSDSVKDQPNKSTRLPLGAIIGIAVGGGALLIIIVLIIVKTRKNKEKPHHIPLENRVEKGKSTIQTIEDVQVFEKLGTGNFSEVFRGLWQNTTPVALKHLKLEEELKEFMAEVTLLQSLNHPNIVRFLGMYVDKDGKKYIVTELMNQGNLPNYIREHKKELSTKDLIKIAVQAAAGMRYLESSRIIHRDLALRNLLVTDSAVVKVGDFGLGRAVESEYYKTEGRAIPIKWSAPEVYHEGKSTSKSDVWSFGVVLWELFSWGRLPYPAFSNTQVIEEIDKGYRMPAPDTMPMEVAKLMVNCWAENPENRPTFREIFDRLDKLLGEEDKRTRSILPYQQEEEEIVYQ